MKLKRAPLIVYLCLMPILLMLGIWQLNRAEEKRELLKLQEQRDTKEILDLSDLIQGNLGNFIYKNIKAEGHFNSDHQYLLDNQINNHKAGYFVLTPFLLKDGDKAILVNRGWVPLGQRRSELPDIRVDQREITLSGRINHFPSVGIKLADATVPSKSWPAVIQVVDADVLSRHLGYSLIGFQIELDKNAAHGFIREWHTPLTMTPEKHVAYAVQWFTLAITLTILYFKYGYKKEHEKS